MWTAKFLVKVSGFIPVIMLVGLFCLAVFKADNSVILKTGIEFGSSTMTLLFMVLTVFNKRFRFCLISKIATIGLVANHLLYKIGDYILYHVYGDLYSIVCCVSVLPIWLILLYSKKNM